MGALARVPGSASRRAAVGLLGLLGLLGLGLPAGAGAATGTAAAVPPLSFLPGVTPSTGNDRTPYLADAAQDATFTGGTLWAWKGLALSAGQCWCTRWQYSSYQTTADGTPGTGDPDTTPSSEDRLIPSRGRYLSRVWPRATAGDLLAYDYDAPTAGFEMLARSTGAVRRGDRAAETEIFIPPDVHGRVAVSGRAVLDRVLAAPDGSRTAYVAPTAPTGSSRRPRAGTYSVSVGTVTPGLRRRVADAAAHPPPPISEPVARRAAEKLLAVAGTSPDATIRSNAGLASTLAALLLGPSDPNVTVRPVPR